MGYRVTVCDARSLFATEARFPEADEVVVDWPHKRRRKGLDEQRHIFFATLPVATEVNQAVCAML
jgi:hypothetical protein